MKIHGHAAAGISRPWLMMAWVLVLAFLVTGVFGRSLWKADEPYSFGIVWEMLADGHWLIPHIAGQPFVEKPPLVYWVAAGFAKALPTLPADQSARLAVLLFAAIGVGALYLAAKRLHPEAVRWCAMIRPGDADRACVRIDVQSPAYATLGVLLMVGTVGFAEHIHKLTADIGQLAGAVVGLCGLIYLGTADSQTRTRKAAQTSGVAGGLMLGNGAGIAFLSKGLLVPLLLLATCLLTLVLPAFRSRTARGAYLVAVLVALPWIVIWPTMFYMASPDLFGEWLWTNNVGRFVGSTLLGGNHRSIANKAGSIAAAAIPAILLIPFVAWRSFRALPKTQPNRWRNIVRHAPGHACIGAFLLVALSVLGMSASMRDVYVLPVLPPMVLLGLPALLLAPARGSRATQAGVVIVFGVLAAMVFGVFADLVTGGNLAGLGRTGAVLGRILPLPFSLPFSWPAIVVAMAATLIWLYTVRHDDLRSAAISWCGGVAMLWTVGTALLLPWIDTARSYEGVFGEIAAQVSTPQRCVAALNLGESELSMLEYVAGIEATRAHLGHSGTGNRATPNPAVRDCDWLIALSNLRSGPLHPDPQRWHRVRTYSRPADMYERITLYRAAEFADADAPSR